MHAVFVTLVVKDGRRDEFLDATIPHAQESVRDEPGCLRLDILEDKTDPSKFYLYAVYESEEAHMNAGRSTNHYAKWAETVSSWSTGDIQAISMGTVFPSDQGWIAQKSG